MTLRRGVRTDTGTENTTCKQAKKTAELFGIVKRITENYGSCKSLAKRSTSALKSRNTADNIRLYERYNRSACNAIDISLGSRLDGSFGLNRTGCINCRSKCIRILGLSKTYYVSTGDANHFIVTAKGSLKAVIYILCKDCIVILSIKIECVYKLSLGIVIFHKCFIGKRLVITAGCKIDGRAKCGNLLIKHCVYVGKESILNAAVNLINNTRNISRGIKLNDYVYRSACNCCRSSIRSLGITADKSSYFSLTYGKTDVNTEHTLDRAIKNALKYTCEHTVCCLFLLCHCSRKVSIHRCKDVIEEMRV